VAEQLDRMARYFDLLDALGVREWVTLDLRIVRGLAYYTGIVFELFDAKGEFRAICGGGRYDNLLAVLGGVDLPALGFGMGDVVLGELLRARKLVASSQQRIDYWVAPTESAAYLDAVRVASRLRATGASAEYPLREQALGKQLKAASGVGAAHVLFVAPTLATTGELEVKSLADGSQQRTTLDAVLERARQSHQGSTDRP